MVAWALLMALVVVAATTAVTLLARALERSRGRAAERERELGAVAARLRSVVDSVTDAILITDGEGQVTLANPAAAQLFAAVPAELAACHIEQLVPAFRGDTANPPGPDPARTPPEGRESAAAAREPAGMAAFRRDGSSFQAILDTTPVVGGEGRIVVVRDLDQVRARAAAMTPPALHDPLTGLASEHQLRAQLAARLQSAGTRKMPFSLFLVDIDDFAVVNREWGHGFGDRLLAAAAERLRQTLRTSDVVSRLGGDDFAVIPGGSATPASSARIARQVLAAFKEPFTIDGRSLEVSVSIGIANFPDHGDDAESLLSHAETARLAATRARRRWMVYNQGDEADEVESRAVRLTELRRALDDQELELFYQPLVRVADSGLVALDATVRWRHRRLGLLVPDQFVRAAEQSEIIRALTRSILGMAVEQQARWRDQGNDLHVVVKIAGRNVQDPQLPRALAGLLERWEVPAARLSLSVDENTALGSTSSVLRALADLGVRIAIDNYGSGSGPLVRLRALPFTELRLDAAVVASVREEGGEAGLVRGTLELAHALGLTVVAKGVDDEATLLALQRLGCDAAEGRLWGDPVPSGAVIPLLRLLARQSRFPGLGNYRPDEPSSHKAGGVPFPEVSPGA